MSGSLRWAKRRGKTDFHARRKLTDDDCLIVIRHGMSKADSVISIVVFHADDSFSQYIEDYDCPEMAAFMAQQTFDQGYLELPVWFEADWLWKPRLAEIREIRDKILSKR